GSCCCGASAPAEGDALDLAVAEHVEHARNRAAATAPVEVTGLVVLRERPDEEAGEAPDVERMARRFEQVLAEAEALVRGRYVKLVDFALEAAFRAGAAERRIAGDFA